MKSLIPWDNYSKKLSKELELNYKPLLDKNLEKNICIIYHIQKVLLFR